MSARCDLSGELPAGAQTVSHNHVDGGGRDGYAIVQGIGLVAVDGQELIVGPGLLAVPPKSARYLRAGLVFVAACAAPT
jgi:mannose-6-phosphate isomerase-like protein (cupin superfamily)